MILPVTYWAGEKNIPEEDQQALCNFFYQSLQQQMSQKNPGADVVKAGSGTSGLGGRQDPGPKAGGVR